MPTLLLSLVIESSARIGSCWAYVMPAMLGATVSINIIFNVINIFISISILHNQQGLTNTLINSLLYLSITVLLMFADIMQTVMMKLRLRRSYQTVF